MRTTKTILNHLEELKANEKQKINIDALIKYIHAKQIGRNKKVVEFKKVLDLVSNGYPIYKSLKILNIHRSTFYNNLKEEQKRMLLETKILQKKL